MTFPYFRSFWVSRQRKGASKALTQWSNGNWYLIHQSSVTGISKISIDWKLTITFWMFQSSWDGGIINQPSVISNQFWSFGSEILIHLQDLLVFREFFMHKCCNNLQNYMINQWVVYCEERSSIPQFLI